jgi:putative transposase
MKYQFMKDFKNEYPIGRMAVIFNVSKSGYYEWLSRKESKRSIQNKKLLEEIKSIHERSGRRYGSPKIHDALFKKDLNCSKNRVIRLMRENNIRSKTKKKFKITTDSKHNNPVAPNILNRAFAVKNPNEVWVSDITYIRTYSGWLYLCVIIDLYSRKVVGYSMSESLGAEIVTNAFMMSWNQRSPKKGLLFHSDRGIQYTSKEFQELLKTKEVTCSMSRKGNCWDNACAESFFHLLKVEEVNHEKYESKDVARIKIFEYIEVFYNNFRTHSYLNYMSPTDFENKKIA